MPFFFGIRSYPAEKTEPLNPDEVCHPFREKEDDNHVAYIYHVFNAVLETGDCWQQVQCKKLDKTKGNT